MALINLLRDLVEHSCGHPLSHCDVRHGLDVEVLGVDHAAAVIVPPRDPEHGRVRHQHLHQSEASITTLGPIRGQNYKLNCGPMAGHYYNKWTNEHAVLTWSGTMMTSSCHHVDLDTRSGWSQVWEVKFRMYLDQS